MSLAKPSITVSGQSVRSIVLAIQSFSVLVDEIHDCLGVPTPRDGSPRAVDPGAWYAIEGYLVAYKKIETLLGVRGLDKVGGLIPSQAALPPTVVDVPSALAALDVAFHMNHARDGIPMFDPATGAMLEGIGHYTSTPIEGKNEIQMVCENPYPCRFDMGLVRGMAQVFEKGATVEHAPGSCRSKGGESCTLVVRW